jgi:hypothetical protein
VFTIFGRRYIAMYLIMIFWSIVNCIYDSSPIRLCRLVTTLVILVCESSLWCSKNDSCQRCISQTVSLLLSDTWLCEIAFWTSECLWIRPALFKPVQPLTTTVTSNLCS